METLPARGGAGVRAGARRRRAAGAGSPGRGRHGDGLGRPRGRRPRRFLLRLAGQDHVEHPAPVRLDLPGVSPLERRLPVLAEHGQHPAIVGLAAGRLDRPRGEAIAVLAPWLLLPAGPGDQPQRHLPGRLGALAGVGVRARRERFQGRAVHQLAQPVERVADPLGIALGQRGQGRGDPDRQVVRVALAERLQRLLDRLEQLRDRARRRPPSRRRGCGSPPCPGRAGGSAGRGRSPGPVSSDSRTVASASRRPWPFPRPRRAARSGAAHGPDELLVLETLERLIQAVAGGLLDALSRLPM